MKYQVYLNPILVKKINDKVLECSKMRILFKEIKLILKIIFR